MALKCYVVYHVIVSSDPTNPQGNSKTRAIISEFGFLVDIRKVQFCEGLVQGAEYKHPMRIRTGNPKDPWRNTVGTEPRL